MPTTTSTPVPPLAQWERYETSARSVGVQDLNGFWYNINHRSRWSAHNAPAVYVVYGPTGTDYGDGVHYMDLDGNPCSEPVEHTTAARARHAVIKHQAAHC